MIKNLKIILKYYRSIVFAFIILILTTIPGSNLNPPPILNFSLIDKVAHFFVFLILSVILFADIKRNYHLTPMILTNTNSGKTSYKKIFFLVLLITFIYGIIIELLQLFFIANRSAEFYDVLANFLGIITGCLLQIKLKIFKF